jgi:diguanylate cyclase (GGDEF)-like protein
MDSNRLSVRKVHVSNGNNKVLIADDHDSTLEHLSEILDEWGYHVTTVEDGEEAWDILQRDDAPRLAILDRNMPGLDGLEIIRRVRQQSQEPYIYILLLTMYDQEKHLVDGLNAGADDYIVKPFRSHELQARLEAGKRILEIQDQLIRTRDKLHSQATTDAGTGLWNRAAILEILDRELDRGRRKGEHIGLAMIDLDDFKRINDSYGHPAGDAVLLECGQRMRNCVRTYDATGRYGGDEFLTVHPGCDIETAVMLGERLRREIAKETVMIGQAPLWVTASAGVVSSELFPEAGADELIALADEALYVAKRAGRNRLEIAENFAEA